MKHAPFLTVLIGVVLGVGTAQAELEITHINIGQGDSTLIRGPIENGQRVSVLVDAGDRSGPDGGEIVREVLDAHGIKNLNFFIVTHYDADHIGGAVTRNANIETTSYGTSFILGSNGVPGAVGNDDNDADEDYLDDYKVDPEELGEDDDIRVGQFVDRGDHDLKSPPSQSVLKYHGIANAKGNRTKIESLTDVDSFSIDLGDGATMFCLSGNGFVRGRPAVVDFVSTENERSLSFLISYKGFHYFIGGDTIGRKAGAENAAVEEAIADFLLSQNIDVDVLRANHHGADNGSSEAFLTKTQPEVAIISAGNGNTHEHPNRDALQRLAESNVKWIYTTEWGNTVWADTVLTIKPSHLSSEQREELDAIRSIRKKLTVAQGHIILTTDGVKYEIAIPPRTFNVDG